MRLSRTDLIPVLAIVAGGVIGASFSFGFLALSPSNEAPAADPVPASTLRFEMSIRVLLTEPLRGDVEEAVARAATLAREQRDMEADMNRLAETGGVPDRQTQRHLLFERKDAMHDEIADLEREIDRLMSESWRDQRAASRRLDQAGGTIVDNVLKERVRYSQGLIGQDREYMREFEAETTRIVEQLLEDLVSVIRPRVVVTIF